MSARRRLCIISGIITLIAMFLTSWMSTYMGDYYVNMNGLGCILNLIVIFNRLDSLDYYLIICDIPLWVLFLYIAFMFLTLASGILLLYGVKKRFSAIIGSICPLFLGVIIVFKIIDVYEPLWFFIIFYSFPFKFGIIPLEIKILETQLGAYILLAGGVLGLIGGIQGK